MYKNWSLRSETLMWQRSLNLAMCSVRVQTDAHWGAVNVGQAVQGGFEYSYSPPTIGTSTIHTVHLVTGHQALTLQWTWCPLPQAASLGYQYRLHSYRWPLGFVLITLHLWVVGGIGIAWTLGFPVSLQDFILYSLNCNINVQKVIFHSARTLIRGHNGSSQY